MGRKIDIGKIAITPEGEWLADRNYEYLSFVQHNGSGYLAVFDNHGIEPGTNDKIWMLVASKARAPEVTFEDGNIYVDGELLSDAVAEANALNRRISTNESARVMAENERIANEIKRQNADAKREATLNDILGRLSRLENAQGN